MMNSLALVCVAVLFVSCVHSCDIDIECIDYGENAHCCENNECYYEDQSCPVFNAGGIVGIVISIIVFVGIVVWVFACRYYVCCRVGSPGHILVSQPPYQHINVTTVTTNTNPCPPPPPQQYGYPQPTPQYGYPQQALQPVLQPPPYREQPVQA